jgi:hypothetical protein
MRLVGALLCQLGDGLGFYIHDDPRGCGRDGGAEIVLVVWVTNDG